MTTVLTNARIVTSDAVIQGSIAINGSLIADVSEGRSTSPAIDMEDDYLIPGIIDIHTDNLERHYFPRPNIDWDAASASIAHDGVCISSGVTTVFDSLSLGAWSNGQVRGRDNLRRLITGLSAARNSGALRADHRIHWRCELPSPVLPELLDEFMLNPLTGLASFMDHTPGQRQYKDLDFFLDRTWRKEMSEAEVAKQLDERRANQSANVSTNRAIMGKMAGEMDVTLAAHDDETAEHVAAAHAAGAVISEFPVTREAAAEAKRLGMVNFMGGPNLVRGGSYSGNVGAAELAADNLLDGFASDYVPRSMIECIFRLTEAPHSWSLPQAVATVTSTPAQAVGLTDRGVLATGLRADLLRVSLNGGLPVVRSAWVAGVRVS